MRFEEAQDGWAGRSTGAENATWLAFGSAKIWLLVFHRHSYVPCLIHTWSKGQRGLASYHSAQLRLAHVTLAEFTSATAIQVIKKLAISSKYLINGEHL